MGFRALKAVVVAVMLASSAGAAWASGVAGSVPWYLDRFGGDPADLHAKYRGRVGVVMARSPRPQLYMSWRLLHGQRVGREAGEALAVPCCDRPDLSWDSTGITGSGQWLAARKLVQGAPKRTYTPTGEEMPYYMWSAQCFDDAFRTAAETLKARVARHGGGSVWVQAWLDAQDAVFATCREDTALPPLPAGAPGWLKSDRAYQEAAHALYRGATAEAADRFGAIARDNTSPWQPMGTYLKARALRRAALDQPTPEAFARARAAIGDLARNPAGAFGRADVDGMLRSLAFRDRPRELMAQLERELADPTPSSDIAEAFRDAASLASGGRASFEAVDWMLTMRPEVSEKAAQAVDWKPAEMARLTRQVRAAARAHALERWRARSDTAWLIAALTLAEPADPATQALMRAGEGIGASDPGWLTVQHHLIRLTLGSTPPAASRARLDAILASKDLSTTDRNLFTAQRLQVAADLADFARHALRRRLCESAGYEDGRVTEENGCKRNVWLPAYIPDSSVFDGLGDKGTVGLGEDARAIIDRMPLAQRIALSRDPRIPGQLKLDIAITSYVRAVLLADHASVDALAGDLARLLPQLAPEWRRIRATPVGPTKRFAEYVVLAKIPGVRADLVDYTRPEGTVAQFQYYWVPWIVVPRGSPVMPEPPPLALYQQDGAGVDLEAPDSATDLTCLGECAYAPAPLRLPDFVVAGQRQSLIERGYIVRRESDRWSEEPYKMPRDAAAVWDEMLAFARANPTDPQVPEALYWINRAGRWGGSHEHSGKRAFQLLHARYPKSTWTKRSPIYWD